MRTPWLTRRQMLKTVTSGFGYLAFAALCSEAAASDKAQDPTAPILRERPLNGLGYRFLREKDTANAIAVFRYVTEAFPRSANAHDSLADAYEAAGQTAEALAEADKVMAMLDTDPSLQGPARDQLRKAVSERKTRLAKK